jgi:hypothetical protein
LILTIKLFDIKSFKEFSPQKVPKENKSWFLNDKMIKRFKWILMQSFLFAINYIQNEISRRNAIHTVNKRHAQVPFFPLL